LHTAANKGNPDVAKTLIKAKANINTTIHVSVTKVHLLIIVASLLSPQRGWTPLHAATYWNRTELVDILIKEGANVNAINQKVT